MRTCRPPAGSAPSRLVASPRSHRSWSLTNNHHNCISLGRAMGLLVIAVGVDQHPLLLSTSHQSGIACVVPRLTSHNCVYFTHFRLPRKKETRLQCPPTCRALEKDTKAKRTLLLAPLSHACLCSYAPTPGTWKTPPVSQCDAGQSCTTPSCTREMKRYALENKREPSSPPCVHTAGPRT